MTIIRAIGTLIFLLSVTGCTVIESRYPTVILPATFENTAERIVVTAPVRRYKDSFYNVALGRYSAANVNIGKKTTENSSVSIGRVTKGDSEIAMFNFYLVDEVEYEQYPYKSMWSYEYAIESASGEQIISQCDVVDKGINYSEVGRLQLGIEITGEVIRTSEWLSTQLNCAIDTQSGQWQLSFSHTRNGEPTVQLNNVAWLATTSLLDPAVADQPATGGQRASEGETFMADFSLPGVSVRKDDQVVSAASLVEGNNAIWLTNDLSDQDASRLLALNYGLILYSWVN